MASLYMKLVLSRRAIATTLAPLLLPLAPPQASAFSNALPDVAAEIVKKTPGTPPTDIGIVGMVGTFICSLVI